MKRSYLYLSAIFFCLLVLTATAKAQSFEQSKDSLLQLLQTSKNDSVRVEMLNSLTLLLKNNNLLDSVAVYNKKAIELASKNHFYNGLAQAYKIKGIIHNLKGESDLSIEAYLEADRNYIKTNNNKGRAQISNNIGNVYLEISEADKALDYLKNAYRLAASVKDTLTMANSITNQGFCYNALKKTEEELRAYEQGTRLYEAIKNDKSLANIFIGMLTVYESKKDYEKAKYYGRKAIVLAKKYNNLLYEVTTRAWIIDFNLKTNHLDSAKTEIDTLIPLLKTEIQVPDRMRVVYQVISKYYRRIKDFENADKYSQMHVSCLLELYEQQKKQDNKQVETVKQLKDKEFESEKMLMEQQKRDVIISYQQAMMLVAIFALVLISGLLYVQYRDKVNLRKTKEQLEIHQLEISNRKIELEQLNATKDRLFSIISHDLMSPVAALNSLLVLLKEDAIASEDVPEFLEEAMTEVGNTTAFLRNLLLWAKNQMEGFSVHKEKLPLQPVVQETVELLQPQIRKKNLNLTLAVPESAVAFADRDLLHTVLRNLLSNAIKFTPEGGHIDINVHADKNRWCFAVKDSGKGIPKEVQDKIWGDTLFSTRGTNNEKGTGIGLLLCRDFVLKNEGKIWFESEAGKGTAFYFTVPMAD